MVGFICNLYWPISTSFFNLMISFLFLDMLTLKLRIIIIILLTDRPEIIFPAARTAAMSNYLRKNNSALCYTTLKMIRNHFVIFNPNGKVFLLKIFLIIPYYLDLQRWYKFSVHTWTKTLCQFSITDDPLVYWG